MKKLLSILGAFTIGSSLAATVVSCNARIDDDSIQYNKTLIKSIIAKILGPDYDEAWFDFGDMAKSGVEAQLVSMINEASSLQYAYESTNSINKDLGLSKYSNVKSFNSSIWQNKLDTVLEDKLFTEYTSSITSDNRLDYTKIADLYTLNMHTKEDVNNTSGGKIDLKFDNNNYYSIYYKKTGSNSALKKWSFFHENGDTSNTETNLPTLEELTAEFKSKDEYKFYLVSNEKEKLKGVNKIVPNDTAGQITSKTAVRLRFQDYFNNSIKASAWENALTLAYGDSTMYNIRKVNNSYQPFINSASPLFNMAQSWKTSKTSKLTTNVKLVWTIKYKAQWDEEVNKRLTELKNNNIINDDGTLNDKGSIQDIINAINDKDKKKIEIDPDSLSYDPYMGLQGYKGMTIYNGTTAIGTSPIANEKYETNIENYNSRGGIVKYNPYYWYTPNGSDNNYHEIVLALPIYTIQLLQDYKLTGSNDDSVALNLGPTASNSNGYNDVWNYDINTELHSNDVTSMDSTIKNSILNDIQYLICQDSSITSLAKSVIYSKYIDPDDIYYSGLYDEIGKYIKSGEDN
ncbi:lipoprotein [Spiroplasma endosymbiont of Aspidapion aeneum]|uniref:lipoprotein n=1 Tax=Spiroplasma endosymbiont of Aspidapion aeneum TaxID=3066276 RepID=UPI00313C410E